MASGYRRTAGTLKVVSGAKGQHRRLDAAVGFFELNRSCRDEARTSIERLNRLIANIGFNDDAFGTGQGESVRSEEHTSELQSRFELVCRLLLEKKNRKQYTIARADVQCARYTESMED